MSAARSTDCAPPRLPREGLDEGTVDAREERYSFPAPGPTRGRLRESWISSPPLSEPGRVDELLYLSDFTATSIAPPETVRDIQYFGESLKPSCSGETSEFKQIGLDYPPNGSSGTRLATSFITFSS